MEMVEGRSVQSLWVTGLCPGAMRRDTDRRVRGLGRACPWHHSPRHQAGELLHGRRRREAHGLRPRPLAGSVEAEGFREATRRHAALHEPGTMPRGVDERTDIYSLGATYHTLLTGWTPYPEPIRGEDHVRALLGAGARSARRRRVLPDACAAIVMRAMAKKRADRYDSARDMQRALRSVLRREVEGVADLTATTRGPGPHFDALAVDHRPDEVRVALRAAIRGYLQVLLRRRPTSTRCSRSSSSACSNAASRRTASAAADSAITSSPRFDTAPGATFAASAEATQCRASRELQAPEAIAPDAAWLAAWRQCLLDRAWERSNRRRARPATGTIPSSN